MSTLTIQYGVTIVICLLLALVSAKLLIEGIKNFRRSRNQHKDENTLAMTSEDDIRDLELEVETMRGIVGIGNFHFKEKRKDKKHVGNSQPAVEAIVKYA